MTEKERAARHLESQRREANRPLGFRPRGVSVSFGEIGVDGLRRDVITSRPVRTLALHRTRPLGICFVFWQNRLQNAVLEHPDQPFFGFHFTNLGWLALLMIPCVLLLLGAAQSTYVSVGAPSDPFDEDW